MKDLNYSRLFDVYGALLTGSRREICELYYLCDLSLTEIAEQRGVSKQSVSDTLAKSRKLLDGYEQKLRVLQTSDAVRRAEELLAAFSAAHPGLRAETQPIAAALGGAGRASAQAEPPSETK